MMTFLKFFFTKCSQHKTTHIARNSDFWRSLTEVFALPHLTSGTSFQLTLRSSGRLHSKDILDHTCLLPPIVTFDRELSHTDNVICHRSTRGLFQSLQRYELSDSNIGYSIKLVGLRINWNLVSFLVLASQLAIIITVIIAVMFIKCWNN